MAFCLVLYCVLPRRQIWWQNSATMFAVFCNIVAEHCLCSFADWQKLIFLYFLKWEAGCYDGERKVTLEGRWKEKYLLPLVTHWRTVRWKEWKQKMAKTCFMGFCLRFHKIPRLSLNYSTNSSFWFWNQATKDTFIYDKKSFVWES